MTHNKEKIYQANKKVISYISLYRYSTLWERMLLGLGMLLAVLSCIGPPMQSLLLGDVFGSIINYATLTANASSIAEKENYDQNLYAQCTTFALLTSIIGIFVIGLSYIAGVIFSYTALKQVSTMRQLLLKHILDMDVEWFESCKTGDFVNSFSESLSSIEEGIGENAAFFLMHQTTFIIAIIRMLILAWKLSLVFLSLSLLVFLIMGVTTKIAHRFYMTEMEEYGSAGCVAEEAIASIRTVVAYEGQRKELQEYSQHLAKVKRNNILRAMIEGLGTGVSYLVQSSGTAFVLWYGVVLIREAKMKTFENDEFNIRIFLSMFNCSILVASCFKRTIPLYEVLGKASGGAKNIFEILATTPRINLSKTNGEEFKDFNGNIVFEDVNFSYPSRPSVKVLTGFTLEVKRGETVALVGSSGCGKSTSIQLIQRFYDPDSGNIFIGDHNIRNLNVTSLRKHIGVVGQEPALFRATVAENIRYGLLNATQMQIERAARRANAHSFIRLLPQGYQTVLGEQGSQLSGGQKQRIAIARALVREPSLLLLDEATSALDTNNEAEVQAAINQISKECTTIIVAHRLSTIRNATKIVVMSKGTVIEQGTHSELVQHRGAYYDLLHPQDLEDELLREKLSKKVTLKNRLSYEKFTIRKNGQKEEKNNYCKTTENVSLWDIIKMNKPEWKYITLGCICSIVIGICATIHSVIFADIIGLLEDTQQEKLYVHLAIYCGAIFGIGVFLMVAGIVQGHAFGVFGETLTKRLRIQMFQSILKQEIGWFDKMENGVGALCERLSGETSNVKDASGIRLGTILNSLITFFVSYILAIYYEWRLALLLIGTSPVLFFIVYETLKVEAGDTEGNKNTFEGCAKIVIEVTTNIRTLASLGCEHVFYEKFVNVLEPHLKRAKRRLYYRNAMLAINRSYTTLIDAAATAYAAKLLVNGMNFVNYFKVTEIVISGSISLGVALSFTFNFQNGILSASRILKIIKRDPEFKKSSETSTKPWDKSNVEYSNVSFTYATRPNIEVLKDLNLSIDAGKTVALVGASGCGKSTVVNLLERFYDYTVGSISVDGSEIKNLDLPTLRSKMAVVSQEPGLFNRTVAENIAYGNNGTEVSMQEIIDAAKAANIHEFVTSLPQGYDTITGLKGTKLSGGQKQRIAIARALIRQPKILLLDEATSALDSESERVVQEALDKAMKNRTCITIAHKLSTIQEADLICIVKEGAIVESGTHKQLMDRKELYYEYYRLQSESK